MLRHTLRQAFLKGFPEGFLGGVVAIFGGQAWDRTPHRSQHRHVRVRQRKEKRELPPLGHLPELGIVPDARIDLAVPGHLCGPQKSEVTATDTATNLVVMPAALNAQRIIRQARSALPIPLLGGITSELALLRMKILALPT